MPRDATQQPIGWSQFTLCILRAQSECFVLFVCLLRCCTCMSDMGVLGHARMHLARRSTSNRFFDIWIEYEGCYISQSIIAIRFLKTMIIGI